MSSHKTKKKQNHNSSVETTFRLWKCKLEKKERREALEEPDFGNFQVSHPLLIMYLLFKKRASIFYYNCYLLKHIFVLFFIMPLEPFC